MLRLVLLMRGTEGKLDYSPYLEAKIDNRRVDSLHTPLLLVKPMSLIIFPSQQPRIEG